MEPKIGVVKLVLELNEAGQHVEPVPGQVVLGTATFQTETWPSPGEKPWNLYGLNRAVRKAVEVFTDSQERWGEDGLRDLLDAQQGGGDGE